MGCFEAQGVEQPPLQTLCLLLRRGLLSPEDKLLICLNLCSQLLLSRSRWSGSQGWGPLARIRYCQLATSAEPRGVRYMGCPSDSVAPLSTPLAPYMLSLAPITSLSAYPALALSRHAGAPSYKILLKPGTLSPRKCGAVFDEIFYYRAPPPSS